jgi:DUF2075 family protein
MIVYKESKSQFVKDFSEDCIEDLVRLRVEEKLHRKVGESEYQSWSNSLPMIGMLLMQSTVPDDANVAIEYTIPSTQNRVDLIISGQNEKQQDQVVLIELKQWSTATITTKDAMVNTRFRQGYKDTPHPSYQAWSYSMLLKSYNVSVHEGNIDLKPCAFLHNYKEDNVIKNDIYKPYIDDAPTFCKDDKRKLKEFIEKYIKFGDKNDVIFHIENGEVRPSKVLANEMVSLLKGNKEFILIDDQKEIFEEAKQLALKAKLGQKQVLVVDGGPGTGKSVVAINLLVELTRLGLVSQYVTKNSAPRDVYEAKLTGHFKKSVYSNLFKGSGAFHDAKKNYFDALVVDEAHRLNLKSGMFSNIGENQVKEIINASSFSVFFIDEDQRVTLKDIGSKEEIKKWAINLGADVTEMELKSQFRCSGSNAYLAWLDNTLGIRSTANIILKKGEYNFKVYDNPSELRDVITKLNEEKNNARIVAGYCWKWKTDSNSKFWNGLTPMEQSNLFDIQFPEYNFAMRWNLKEDGMLWILKPSSVNEVGCIHTCQGLELDHIGVIIGDDFIVRNDEIIINPSAHPGSDKALQTWKEKIACDPIEGKKQVERVIKNTYRTLMTRGAKSCHLFCTDEETRNYFKKLMN